MFDSLRLRRGSFGAEAIAVSFSRTGVTQHVATGILHELQNKKRITITSAALHASDLLHPTEFVVPLANLVLIRVNRVDWQAKLAKWIDIDQYPLSSDSAPEGLILSST